MAKAKDIIVRRSDGMYVMRRVNGELGWTDKLNATHFTGKSKANKEFPTLKYYEEVQLIDLNRKGKSNDKNKL